MKLKFSVDFQLKYFLEKKCKLYECIPTKEFKICPVIFTYWWNSFQNQPISYIVMLTKLEFLVDVSRTHWKLIGIQIKLYNIWSKTSLNVLQLFLLLTTWIKRYLWWNVSTFFLVIKQMQTKRMYNKNKFNWVLYEKKFCFEVNFQSYLESLMQVWKKHQKRY